MGLTTKKEYIYNFFKKKAANTILNLIESLFQKTNLISYPQIVDMVITKNCNLNCCFCKKYSSDTLNISLNNFEKIASQLLPKARKLNICSGGEPFIHKNIIDILRISKKYDVWISVVSNGMLLNEHLVNQLVGENLIDSLAFSVDGIIPVTVNKIRNNANFSIIAQNIKYMIEVVKKSKSKRPIISIRYTLMKENIAELPSAISFWGEMGVDTINCNYLSLCNGIEKNQSLYFHQSLTEQIFKEAQRIKHRFKKLSLSTPKLPSKNRLYNKKIRSKKCYFPWMFTMIDADGRIFPGYNSWGAIVAGNMLNDDKSFFDIWNSKVYRNLRKTVNNDSIEKEYNYCSICPVRHKNNSEAWHFGDELFEKYIYSEQKSNISIKRFQNYLYSK